MPFYFELEPAEYAIEISCPQCGTKWYVVWDDDPVLSPTLLREFEWVYCQSRLTGDMEGGK